MKEQTDHTCLRFNVEPTIDVGVMHAPSIRYSLEREGQSLHTAEFADGAVVIDGEPQGPVCQIDAPDGFRLYDVPIGIGFHWQRTQTQLFPPSLVFIADRTESEVVAVNRVALETYLKSVISSEMSGTSPSHLLKAHAIVSRSWLLRQIADEGKHHQGMASQLGKRRVGDEPTGREVDELVRWYDREDHTLFDVCADDHCQRYQGFTNAMNPYVAEAVEATRGLVLTFGGEICDARFSKCCGGRSEIFASCWEDALHPYLEPVDDPYCDTRDEAVLRQVMNGYDCESLDFHDWEVTLDPEGLGRLILEKTGYDFGTILDLRPLERGESGRITRLLVTGTKREMAVGKELEIRRWLSPTHLRSSNFSVERTADGRFRLRGKGWGHGVGMCQIGAAVMSSKGFGYEEILRHYFPKASLTKIY